MYKCTLVPVMLDRFLIHENLRHLIRSSPTCTSTLTFTAPHASPPLPQKVPFAQTTLFFAVSIGGYGMAVLSTAGMSSLVPGNACLRLWLCVLTLALAPDRFRHAPSPRRGLLLGVAGGLSRSFCGGGLWGNLPHAPRPRIQGATPSNRYLEHTLARVRVRGVGARAFTCVVQPAGASVPTLALELLTADWALPCSGHHLFLHSVLFLAWQGGGGPIIVSIWGSEHDPRLRERALHPEAAHSTRAQGRCETRLSDDDVQYYLHERLKLEGKTGNRSRCATESIFWEPQRLGRVLRRQVCLRCSVKLTSVDQQQQSQAVGEASLRRAPWWRRRLLCTDVKFPCEVYCARDVRAR